jgi:hypothetical protein
MNVFTKQLNEDVLIDVFDLAIYTSGYEPRSVFLFSKNIKSINTVVLGFKSFENHNTRIDNDNFFKKNGISIINADGNSHQVIYDILSKYIRDNLNPVVRIFIDYSSMTRVWYGCILSYFNDNNFERKQVEIIFGYSFATYQAPPTGSYRNLFVSPIDGFSYFSIPDKPTAVLIGLGYEKNKAFGLSEYFDGKTFLFYNNDATDQRFTADIEVINFQLIQDTPEENIFTIPIKDLEFSERQLLSLCDYLKQECRVVIAPSGPKPFTLLSLIIAIKLKEVDVWRISQGDNRNPIQFEANGEISYYKVTFDYNT